MKKLFALLLISGSLSANPIDIDVDPHKAKLSSCVGVYHAYSTMFTDRQSIGYYQQKAQFTANLVNQLIRGERVEVYRQIASDSYLKIKLSEDLDMIEETVRECDLSVIDGLKEI